jgi:hypothetical protein
MKSINYRGSKRESIATYVKGEESVFGSKSVSRTAQLHELMRRLHWAPKVRRSYMSVTVKQCLVFFPMA